MFFAIFFALWRFLEIITLVSTLMDSKHTLPPIPPANR